MSIYNATDTPSKIGVPKQSEIPVYGATRLGVYVASGLAGDDQITGNYRYELTDHLGNVRAVIGKTSTGTPFVVARTDYYPFGMAMPGRNVEGSYRYKYQGQEKDPETGMEAFELRLWDSRIGRWLTVDPYGYGFSPYVGMSNNPISNIDVDGGCSCQECPDTCADKVHQLDPIVMGGSTENIPSGSWGADAVSTLGGFDYTYAHSTAQYQKEYPEFEGMDYDQMVGHFESNHGERWEQDYARFEAESERQRQEDLARHLMGWGNFYAMASIAGPNYTIPRIRFGPRVGPVRGMNFNNPNSFRGLEAKQVKQYFEKHGWSVKETKNGWSATNPKKPSDVYKYVKGYTPNPGSTAIEAAKQGAYLKNGLRLGKTGRVPLQGNPILAP